MITKKWLNLLIFALYLTLIFPLALIISIGSETYNYNIPGGIFTFLAVVLVTFVAFWLNIGGVLRCSKVESLKQPKKYLATVLLYKLLLLPYFLVLTLLFLIALGVTANPLLLALWAVIPLLFLLYLYLALLPTSLYTFIFLHKTRKVLPADQKVGFWHFIWQLLPLCDLLDSLYLYFKYRHSF